MSPPSSDDGDDSDQSIDPNGGIIDFVKKTEQAFSSLYRWFEHLPRTIRFILALVSIAVVAPWLIKLKEIVITDISYEISPLQLEMIGVGVLIFVLSALLSVIEFSADVDLQIPVGRVTGVCGACIVGWGIGQPMGTSTAFITILATGATGDALLNQYYKPKHKSHKKELKEKNTPVKTNENDGEASKDSNNENQQSG